MPVCLSGALQFSQDILSVCVYLCVGGYFFLGVSFFLSLAMYEM